VVEFPPEETSYKSIPISLNLVAKIVVCSKPLYKPEISFSPGRVPIRGLYTPPCILAGLGLLGPKVTLKPISSADSVEEGFIPYCPYGCGDF
jgi:hypothetical protein